MAFTILGLWLFTAVMFGMGGGLTIFLYTETRSSNYWIYRMIATAAPFLFWYLIFFGVRSNAIIIQTRRCHWSSQTFGKHSLSCSHLLRLRAR